MLHNATISSSIDSLSVTVGDQQAFIFPAFNKDITDYCVLTNTTINEPVPSFSISVNDNLYTEIASIKANDLIQFTDTSDKTYYVRFLPRGVVTGSVKYGPTAEYEKGYYLVGHPYPTEPSNNIYHTIYDYNGVPIWYVNTGYTSRSLHSTLSSNVVLANHESGYPRYMIDLNNFNGQFINATKFNILSSEGVIFTSTQYTNVQSPLDGWGLHEFQVIDIEGHGTCAVADGYTTKGFYIQIMDTSKNIVWDWRSEDYLGVQPTEYFHLNSVDVHPTTLDVLVSLRHNSAVFCIDYYTKQIKWVLQGEPAVLTGAINATLLPLSGYALSAVNTLQIVNDAIYAGHQYAGPMGQHDARWRTSIAPINGGQHVISFYDDQKARPTAGITVTFPHATNLPRAVIFEIDVNNGFAYNRSSITNSGQSRYMGSYSIVNGLSGISHTVDYVEQHPPLVEFIGPIDEAKTKTFAMDFSNSAVYSENTYRITKTPLTSFNIDYLRASAGFPVLFPEPVPSTDTEFLQLSSAEIITDLNIDVGGNTIFPSTFTIENRDYCVLTGAAPQASISYDLTINGQTSTDPIAANVNKCLQIYDGVRTYYIRFLPTNILLPDVTFYNKSAYSPGYYTAVHGEWDGTYYTILNGYGVPLWYVNIPGDAPYSLHVGMSANRLITNSTNSQRKHIIQINNDNLQTEIVDLISYPYEWDIHESTEVRAPLSRMGNVIGHRQDEYDGLYIEEQDANGAVVWTFDINDYFDNNPSAGGDTYHTNSIDVHPETGDLLCSSRHTSTVFCIDYETKLIKWVIQGDPYYGVTMQQLQKEGTPTVTYITSYNEPYYADYQYTGIRANHDARWHTNIPPLTAGNIVISLFDDQTELGPYARAVIYEVNPTLGTAYCRSSIFSEQGNMYRMGSYRINREEDNTYTHTIGWGGDGQHPSMTEYRGGVDGINGRTKVLTSNFPDNMYRYLKYPIDSFNIDYLRKTVGVPLNIFIAPPPLPPNVNAYWNLNETSGTRHDSLSGALITETGGTIGSTDGVRLKAARITNGDEAWLTLPAGICDIGDRTKSFSFWFKLDQTNVGYQWIWCQGTNHDHDEINLLYVEGGGQLNMLFMTDLESHWAQNLPIIIPTANEWHHYVATFGEGVAKCYYDGSLVATIPYNGVIKSSNSNYTLGHYNAYPNGLGFYQPFAGVIDEVRIWNKVLTQNEVSDIYNTTPVGNVSVGVLAYWKLNEETGTRLDSTGNGFDLLVNASGTETYQGHNNVSEINYGGIVALPYNVGEEHFVKFDGTLIYSEYGAYDGHNNVLVVYDHDNETLTPLAYNDTPNNDVDSWYTYNTNINFSLSFTYKTVGYDANGVIDNAAAFDRTSYLSYYNVAEDLPLPINHNNFSVAGWVKLGDNGDIQTFFSQWNNAGISWGVGYTNNGLDPESIVLTVSTYSVYKIDITPNIPLVVGEWYHIAFTYDGVNILLYLNSQLVGSATNSSGIYNSSAPVEIGSINGGSDRLNGSIDELGIWNRALSQEDIFNLYYRGDGNSYPFSKPVITQNLNDKFLAYYPLDENTGTRYDFANGYDLSQNGVIGSEKGIKKQAASFLGTANNGLYNTNITTWYNWSYSYWVNVRSDFSNNPENPMFITTGNFNGGSGYSQTTYFVPISSDIIQIGHYDEFSNSIFPNVYTTKYGTWNHITLTNNNLSGISLYVNGNLIDSTNDQGVDRSWNTINLDGYRNGTYVFDGLLDDVKIWNRSITPNEIASIYKSGLPTTSKYNFQKVLGIPTYTFEKVTPQSILDLPFYIKSGSGAGSLTIPLYQDGLYGKRYVGYYPDNGGVNAFGTLSVHGDEQATVDFYNFTSSADYYSWQWTGYFKAPYTDEFVFRIANVDDSVDLWVGDNAISGFTSENRTTGGLYMADNSSDPIPMIGGQYYPVRLQFGENDGGDHFILEYSSSYETNVTNFQGRFFHLTHQDLPV